jgi:S-adenosylmethionine-diacylglycerol 3-amino-3-carboxypropyl transferase
VTTQPVMRTTLADAVDDRLFFAQVREDARAEIEALHPAEHETVAVVSSGGCTALSLLASGAGHVIGVDRNATQNHLVELKAAAAALGARDATAFLGGVASTERRDVYAQLRDSLTAPARLYWDGRPEAIARGVLAVGVSERFIAAVVAALRVAVHPRGRITRLLDCQTVDEQRALFEGEWDTRRWRALFAILCNRLAFRSTYPPAFFANVENPSFAQHFRRLAEHAITELPVADNYFLHQMLTGSYPVDVPDGVPAYLSPAGCDAVTHGRNRLTLTDGGMTECLATRPDASVDAFALSNICEWMDAAQIDGLFREVLRTAAPGARLVYRNFVGWTELPEWCERIVPDETLSARLTWADRSVVQRRVVACTIAEAA